MLRFLFIINLLIWNLIAKNLVSIPEASGIDYSYSTNSFFIANDEGTLYEINEKGKILNKKFIGNYDLEGISNFNKNLFLTVDENTFDIFFINKKTLKIKKILNIKNKKASINLFKKKKKEGIEGIAFYKNYIYMGIQSKKKPSYILIFDLKGIFKDFIKINIKDISGLKINNNILYIISDKKNKILLYNLKKKKIIKKIHNIKGEHQEGITIFNNNYYISDDSGYIFNQKYNIFKR